MKSMLEEKLMSSPKYSNEWDTGVFERILENRLQQCIEAAMWISNVRSDLQKCHDNVITQFTPTVPVEIANEYNKLFEEFVSKVEQYTVKMKRYFAQHYVCINNTTQLQTFCSKELQEIQKSLDTNEVFAKNGFVARLVRQACARLKILFSNQNQEIIKNELHMAKCLTEQILNLYSYKISKIMTTNSEDTELKRLHDECFQQCMNIFTRCLDYDGKQNEAIIEYEEALKQNLQETFQIKKNQLLKAVKSNSHVSSMLSQAENFNKAARLTKPRFNTSCISKILVFRLTEVDLTMGWTRPDGSTEIIQNARNERSTEAVIGKSKEKGLMYGSAATNEMRCNGQKSIKLWYFRDVIKQGAPKKMFDYFLAPGEHQLKIDAGFILGNLIGCMKTEAERILNTAFTKFVLVLPFWVLAEKRNELTVGIRNYANLTVKLVDEVECLAMAYLDSPNVSHDLEKQRLLLISLNSEFVDSRLYTYDRSEGRISFLDYIDSGKPQISGYSKQVKLSAIEERIRDLTKTHGKENIFAVFGISIEKNSSSIQGFVEKYFPNRFLYQDSKKHLIKGAGLADQNHHHASTSKYHADALTTSNGETGMKKIMDTTLYFVSSLFNFSKVDDTATHEPKKLTGNAVMQVQVPSKQEVSLMIVDQLRSSVSFEPSKTDILAGCYDITTRKQKIIEAFQLLCHQFVKEDMRIDQLYSDATDAQEEDMAQIKIILRDYSELKANCLKYEGPHFTKEYRKLQERCSKLQRVLDKLNLDEREELRNQRKAILIKIDMLAKMLADRAHDDGNCCNMCELKS